MSSILVFFQILWVTFHFGNDRDFCIDDCELSMIVAIYPQIITC